MRDKSIINKWSIWEIIWLIVAVGTVSFIAVTSENTNIVQIFSNIAAVCGVTYVILIAKQDKIAYFFGMVNVLFYAFASFNQQLFANAAYNMFYSFPMMIYGFIYWKKNENSADLGIKSLSKRSKLIVGAVLVVAIIIMAVILKFFEGKMCFLDATMSITAALGMYFMTNKYMEQWPVWIIGNVAGTIMWGFLTIDDRNNLSLFVMWSIYTLNSLYGFANWKRIQKQALKAD